MAWRGRIRLALDEVRQVFVHELRHLDVHADGDKAAALREIEVQVVEAIEPRLRDAPLALHVRVERCELVRRVFLEDKIIVVLRAHLEVPRSVVEEHHVDVVVGDDLAKRRIVDREAGQVGMEYAREGIARRRHAVEDVQPVEIAKLAAVGREQLGARRGMGVEVRHVGADTRRLVGFH